MVTRIKCPGRGKIPEAKTRHARHKGYVDTGAIENGVIAKEGRQNNRQWLMSWLEEWLGRKPSQHDIERMARRVDQLGPGFLHVGG